MTSIGRVRRALGGRSPRGADHGLGPRALSP